MRRKRPSLFSIKDSLFCASKVTSWSLYFFNFMPLRGRYIYIHIYTICRGKSRLRRRDDGGNDEIAEEEGWREGCVGFDCEVRRYLF